MHPSLLHLAAALVVPAAIDGADWPLFRGDPGLRGVAATTLCEHPVLLWTHSVGKAITSSPAVSAGRVFFGADDQHVHALNLLDGAEVWRFATEDVIEAPPLCFAGRVYIGSSDGKFYALSATDGALVWSYATEDKILGGANALPAQGDQPDRVVVGSYDGKLYCLNAATGALCWSYATGNYVNGTPAIAGEQVVFGGCDAVLHLVSTKDGSALAQIPLGPEAHVAGSVAYDQGRVYFGHYGNAFLCVDLERKESLWTYGDGRFAFFSSAALGAEVAIFGGRDKQLHCVRRSTGERLWSYPTRRKLDNSPILCGERVIVGTAEGRLLILAVADGKELWSYDLGSELYASPAVASGRILVATADGRVCAFGAPPPSTASGDKE